MAHNDFVMPAGQWVIVPTPGRLARLDQQISESLNGDDGGTWAPSTPIAIGGAGLTFDASLVPSQFSGGVRTGRGQHAAHAPAIRVPGAYRPHLSPPRSRSVLLMPVSTTVLDQARDFRFTRDGSVAPSYRPGTDAINFGFHIPAASMHNGATLASVTFRWRLAQEKLVVGDEQFLLWRTPRTGGATTYMRGTDGAFAGVGYNLIGMATPLYASPSDYWAGGSVKSLTYVTDQLNTVDTSGFVYVGAVRIVDPAILHSVELTFTNITQHDFQ